MTNSPPRRRLPGIDVLKRKGVHVCSCWKSLCKAAGGLIIWCSQDWLHPAGLARLYMSLESVKRILKTGKGPQCWASVEGACAQASCWNEGSCGATGVVSHQDQLTRSRRNALRAAGAGVEQLGPGDMFMYDEKDSREAMGCEGPSAGSSSRREEACDLGWREPWREKGPRYCSQRVTLLPEYCVAGEEA